MAAPTGRTPNRGHPFPIPDDQVDVPRDIQALAVSLDGLAYGTLAGRPTAGHPGATYYAQDVQTLYYDIGTGWVAIGGAGMDNIPVGVISSYGGTAPPNAKWLLCDNFRYQIADYPDLGALCGTAFNITSPPDPAGTFRVPDLRGRVAVGTGVGGKDVLNRNLTARNRGNMSGEEVHALLMGEAAQKAITTPTEVQDHIHNQEGVHPLAGDGGGTAWANATGAAGPTIYITNPATGGRSSSHTHVIPGVDASTPHNTMPPFTALGAIIKALP